MNPHDPDAQITKMKDGRTHLAHKAEHAVDLETGAIVAAMTLLSSVSLAKPSWKRFMFAPQASRAAFIDGAAMARS